MAMAPPDPAMMLQDIMNQPAPPVIPVNTWDNHAVHIQTHNDFRKTQAFESLPPEIKDEFERHVNEHLHAVSDSMMQAQQYGGMMQMMPGSGGPVDGSMNQPQQSDPGAQGPMNMDQQQMQQMPPGPTGGIPNG